MSEASVEAAMDADGDMDVVENPAASGKKKNAVAADATVDAEAGQTHSLRHVL